MTANIGLERCLTFINCQLTPGGQQVHARDELQRRAITISRQSGAGAHAVGGKLVEYLQSRSPENSCPWTVFDQNLVEKVLDDHHMPKRLAQFMPEDRISETTDTLDELFGLHPPSITLVRQTSETILRLAEMGNVVIIGRGATIITRRLEYMFHVRLVGSLEKRTDYIQNLHKLTREEARKLIRREDRGRTRYLKKYFGEDVSDPLLYHLTINTDLVSYQEAAVMIGDAVLGPPVPDATRM